MKNKIQTLSLVIITATTGALSAIIGLTNTLIIIGIFCLLLFIPLLLTIWIIKKVNKHKLTDEDKKWNKMLDLWIGEKLESPYTELMTYYNEVMNGGHSQYFTNIENTKDIQKEINVLETTLPKVHKTNLKKAYKAYLAIEKNVDDERAEEILRQCDDTFYENEDTINSILKEYASTIQL